MESKVIRSDVILELCINVWLELFMFIIVPPSQHCFGLPNFVIKIF